jgi:hypothetical protein
VGAIREIPSYGACGRIADARGWSPRGEPRSSRNMSTCDCASWFEGVSGSQACSKWTEALSK